MLAQRNSASCHGCAEKSGLMTRAHQLAAALENAVQLEERKNVYFDCIRDLRLMFLNILMVLNYVSEQFITRG